MFKFTGFYLLTGLPGDRNRLQGVGRGNRQDGLSYTYLDGDCVTIPTVNPWVRSVPTYSEPYIITHILELLIVYATGKRGHVTNRSRKSWKNMER